MEKELQQQKFDMLKRTLFKIQHQLCNLTPKRFDLHDQIYEVLDVDFIVQMIQHHAFERNDAKALVLFVISRIKKLQSLEDDEETRVWEKETMQRFNAQNMTSFFAQFLLDVERKLHRIQEQVLEFFKNLGTR